MDPRSIVRRLAEGFVGGSVPEELLDSGFQDHSLAMGLPNGPEAFTAMAGKLRGAFPDARLEVAEVLAEGDRVCLRGEFVGTHRGPWEGNPPSGMLVRVPWLDLWQVQGGRVVTRWGGPDFASLLQQIGALPMPEPA